MVLYGIKSLSASILLAGPVSRDATETFSSIFMKGDLGPFLRLHRLFAADDVARIHTSADLIHCYSESANVAFVDVALFYTLFYTLFCHFSSLFLFYHDLLLAIGQFCPCSSQQAENGLIQF